MQPHGASQPAEKGPCGRGVVDPPQTLVSSLVKWLEVHQAIVKEIR